MLLTLPLVIPCKKKITSINVSNFQIINTLCETKAIAPIPSLSFLFLFSLLLAYVPTLLGLALTS